MCGLAMFDDRTLIDLRPIPGGPGPWDVRMGRIAGQIQALARASEWSPDIIAVEDVVLHSGWLRKESRRRNAGDANPALLPDPDADRGGPGPQTLKIMSETRGYLRVVFGTCWPAARIRDVHPSRVRGVIGAGSRRAAAKTQNRWALTNIARWTRPATQDECDAFVIGLAAMEDIQRDTWAAMAR